MRNWLFFILFLGFFVSCKRQICLKPAGKEVTKEHSLTDFSTLEIQSKLVPTIIIDTVNYVKISAGENLIDFISFDFNDDFLTILNRNECNFLRSYKKKVSIELHCKPFSKLIWRGSEPIEIKGILNSQEFTLQLDEGAHEVNLNVNSEICNVVTPVGSAKFILNGQTNILNINNSANCSGDTRNLQVNEAIYIENYSPGSVFLNANCPLLNCTIFGSGDVKYIGNPVSIESNIYGTGALIDSN